MKNLVKLSVALVLSAVVTLFGAAYALACIPIATLNLSADQATPGTEVTAAMHQASSRAGPVTLHWDSADGPVLASVVPDPDAGLTTTFTVPQTAAGYHVVVATQDLNPGVATWGMPARAVMHVTTPGGLPVGSSTLPPVQTQTRPSGLVAGSGPDWALLAVIGVATAAVSLIAAGGAALILGRSPNPEAVRR